MGKPLRISMEPLRWLQTFAWQLLLVAYPEEAFYRGYLQSRLDAVWTPRWRIVGAALGPGVLLAGVAFTVAHLAVEPRLARLLVFPAALLFGWLRARTQGIGASTVLHAIYNALANITSHSG